MAPLSALFERIGFQVEGYHSKNRSYRSDVKGIDAPVRAKIMAEKDVALQVAAGNYNIGFCGLDWILEHRVRFPGTSLHVVKRLGLDVKLVRVCSAMDSEFDNMPALLNKTGFVTIVSEYPNLSEDFAIKTRLKRFRIFTAWGRVESYPPENADLVILSVPKDDRITAMGLQKITGQSCNFESCLCLVVNRKHFYEKDLSPILAYFQNQGR